MAIWKASRAQKPHGNQNNKGGNKMMDLQAEVLLKENGHLVREKEELERKVQAMGERIANLRGKIEGLEFAIRCNGISGSDIRG